MKLHAAVRDVGSKLDRLEADVVVGLGGYVALPAYLAARQRKTPIVNHEANVRAGLANRIGARLTPYVCTASPSVRLPHATPVGLPLRPTISGLNRVVLREEARRRFGLQPEGTVLLATGGSQGAQRINDALVGASQTLQMAGIQILHIAGAGREVTAPAAAATAPPYVIVPYVDDMRLANAAADLALCRSGAMTCAELAAVGLPAAYVPLPQRGGEQRLNAEGVVAAGGALLFDDSELAPEWICEVLLPVLTDAARISAMSSISRSSIAVDAGQVLARHVLATLSAPAQGTLRTRIPRSAWKRSKTSIGSDAESEL